MSSSPVTSSLLNSVLQATTGSNGGINVSAAVAAVIAAESTPELSWQSQQSSISSEATAINQLQTESSSLSDQLNALNDSVGVLSAVNATTSNTNIVTASAESGTATGTHIIEVTNLAATASWYSATETTSSAPLTAGSLTINANGLNTPITFGGSGQPDTLDQLASYINGQGLGVTANVIKDSSGARLSLVAQASGTAADFSVSGTTGLNFTRAVTGLDAALTIDGVPISSSTNTVSNAVLGLTLNLQSAAPGTPVALTLAPDSNQITTTVSSLVSAYNTLIQNVNAQFAYNNTTGTSGALSGDSIVRGLQSSLLAATNFSAAGNGAITSLAALGISTNQDGTLALNSSKLASAISSNPAAVTNFFQGSSQNGFASSLNSVLNTYTDPSEGAFTIDLSSLNHEYEDLGNQISSFQRYLTTEQARLTTEYNNADIALQQLPQQIQQTQTLLGENVKSSNG